MHLHREGTFIMLGFGIFTALGITLTQLYIPYDWLKISLTILFALFYLIIVQFFRIPHRKVVQSENGIISPADGKVVVIEEVEEPEYFKGKRLMISVFMSPLNVHANYFPISGSVNYYKYHPGKFLVAWHPKSSTDNERSTTVVKHKNGEEVLFRQVAGALAKRIINYAEVNQPAEQASEFGFIKFGSRVDLYLPLTANVKVSLNEKVKGQISELATFS
jgi:phosphatidylserine decarboxylase